MKNEKSEMTFPSMRAAASASGIPFAALVALKAAGSPGFNANGRVHLREVLAAVFRKQGGAEAALPPGMRNWREVLAKAQAERVQLRLDHERNALIARAWVAERFHLFGGDLDKFRAKSEAEHPLLFAAAAGDVPACRELVRKVWDDIMRDLNSLKRHFAEDDDKKSA